MNPASGLITLFFAHLVGDFFLQSRKMGNNKSSSLKYLSMHIAILTAVLGFASLFVFPSVSQAVKFTLLNSAIHMAIDAVIWNLYKVFVKITEPTATPANFRYWEKASFYSCVGTDQFLHGATIIGLYFFCM